MLRMGQLTASLSHELNQPLTAILSTAQAGIRFLETNRHDPELLKEVLHKVVENDKRAAGILSGIRGMMKLENRKKDRINLNSLIEELLTIYRGEAIDQKIKIVVKLTEKPVFIFADRILISQVVLNLLSNAINAMETAGSTSKVVEICETAEGDHVTVSVRDYGTGISKAVEANLFKPFITSRTDGLGIGLAISRDIIEDHQGTIWAENQLDRGAKFSFRLKIQPDA
jgi:two-component system sensor kinase FixL